MTAGITISILAAVAILLAWLIYASASIHSGVYIRTLCQVRTDKKIVALTFDDAPHARQTPRILEILRQHDIKATFFCIGHNIERHPDIAARIAAEGHIIGNHSYSHSNTFPLLPSRRMADDIARCENLIDNIAPAGKRLKLFRPPFGVTNPTVASVVKKGGYTTIGWNIRSLDTVHSTTEAFNHIVRRLKPGSVILLHDRLPQSHILLAKLIDHLKQENYEIVNIDTLFNLKSR